MFEFLGAIVPLFFLIYQEWMSDRAKAKKENKKFILDQTAFNKIVDAAVDQWNEKNLLKSKEAKSAWDAADKPDDDPSGGAP